MSKSKEATRFQEKGLTVGQLVDDDQLKVFGYLLLSFHAMQKVGGATQTISAIRSHWGKSTWADPRTIAVAACLDESTVRRRHLPKLVKVGFLDKTHMPSRLGERCVWSLSGKLASGYFTTKRATLPRWAALSLPEWSYRAVYATVLQRSLATARGSANGPVPLEVEDVASGNYGRHNFSISHLCGLTGLNRESVVRAKEYLLDQHWLTWSEGYGHGKELYLNSELFIPYTTLQEAHRTTRSVMFKKVRQQGKESPAHGLRELGKERQSA